MKQDARGAVRDSVDPRPITISILHGPHERCQKSAWSKLLA